MRTLHPSTNTRLMLLGLLLATLPAHAQFGWFEGTTTTSTPATPEPPIPAADLELWLKNAQKSADAARAAQKKGDATARNAAIKDAAQWAHKISMPHNVPDASRRAAIETIGLLARDMNVWKSTFKETGLGTELVMLDVRADTLIKTAPGAEKARIHMHLGEIGAAQEYSHEAFENFLAAVQITDAEAAVVKAAAERAILYIPLNNPRTARPIYDRMLALTLSPAEQKRWQNLRAVHVLETEYKGDERDAAKALIKSQVLDPKTPVAEREELALALEEKVSGEEAYELYEAMLARPNLDPVTKARWLSLRAHRKINDRKYSEAAADYELAAQAAPANSLHRDEALWNNAQVRLTFLNAQNDVPAKVAPTLESLAASPRMSMSKRFDASSHLSAYYFETKNFVAAQKLAVLRKQLAGTNLPRQIEADMDLVQANLGLGLLEAATTIWTAQPYDLLAGNAKIKDDIKIQATRNLQRTGASLYGALITAKKLDLAQQVIGDRDADKIFGGGDYQLLIADLALNMGNYDRALTTLRQLLAAVYTDQDKAVINSYIANVQKLKAAQPATAAAPAGSQ